MTVPDDDLEAVDAWDWDAAEKRPGISDGAVTVSIRLGSAEFEAVAECAERAGMSVSEFVRTRTVDAARERSSSP